MTPGVPGQTHLEEKGLWVVLEVHHWVKQRAQRLESNGHLALSNCPLVRESVEEMLKLTEMPCRLEESRPGCGAN